MQIAPIDALPPSSAPAHEGAVVSVPGGAAPVAAASPPTPAEFLGAIQAANDALRRQGQPVQLDFEYDHDAHVTVVRLVDAESGQVLRQIPTQELLAIAHALDGAQGKLIHGEA